MRALLLLLALLLALPAAALELLPTTLQLPAEGGRAELWLHNPGPGRWQGRVQVLAWDQQLDAERLHPSDQIRAALRSWTWHLAAPSASGCCPATPCRQPPNRPIGSSWRPRCRACRAIPCRCSAARRRRPGRPWYRAALRRTRRKPLCDSAIPVICTLACMICASSPRTADHRCCCPGWPATSWPGMIADGPCPPAPMATQVAASRPACRTAATLIWSHPPLRLQHVPATGYNRPDSCRLRAREPVHTGRHR